MSEANWHYLIETCGVVALSAIARFWYQSKQEIKTLRLHINSRMDELLSTTQAAATAVGHAAGVSEERSRKQPTPGESEAIGKAAGVKEERARGDIGGSQGSPGLHDPFGKTT